MHKGRGRKGVECPHKRKQPAVAAVETRVENEWLASHSRGNNFNTSGNCGFDNPSPDTLYLDAPPTSVQPRPSLQPQQICVSEWQ